MTDTNATLDYLFGTLFKSHPWHGVTPGIDAPARVNAFIELVPTDVVKYELDKNSGHLKIDRPQRYSSLCPTPYGFVPQTYCGTLVGQLCEAKTGIKGIKGDGDPIDICVLTERTMAHGDFFVSARPIGGLRMIDGDESDDKIIAVLESDVVYGRIQDISEVPTGLIDRLRHYFLSYKQFPGEAPRKVEITDIYGRADAEEVILRSIQDYRDKFGPPEDRLEQLRRILSTLIQPR